MTNDNRDDLIVCRLTSESTSFLYASSSSTNPSTITFAGNKSLIFNPFIFNRTHTYGWTAQFRRMKSRVLNMEFFHNKNKWVQCEKCLKITWLNKPKPDFWAWRFINNELKSVFNYTCPYPIINLIFLTLFCTPHLNFESNLVLHFYWSGKT